MKIYQLLSAVTFRDSPAHPVSFVSKHGYDWLNADKQLEFWKYFNAQLESIVKQQRHSFFSLPYGHWRNHFNHNCISLILHKLQTDSYKNWIL